MPIRRISVKAVAELAPGQTIWDSDVKGFGVRRQRHAAVYVLKYRDQNGRQHFLTIGRHGSPWTPDTARKEARRHLLALTECQPNTGGLSGPTPTLEAFSKTYLESYAHLHKKPRSVAEDRRNLELHILPALGSKSLAEITAADIAQFHTLRGKHPSNANRCLALLSHIFSIGAKWGVIPAGVNPCRGIKRFRERIRERLVSGDEVALLGATLAEVESSRAISEGSEDWRAVNVIRLLVYTGARLSEILTLEWGWVQWEGGFARLPDSKTGAKTLPLPQPALDLLRKISEERGRQSQFVFPGKRNGTYFTGIQKPWQRIRLKAGLPDVRIHDLRHCFASTAVAHGESLYLVGAVLGHRTTSTTQRYAHLAMQPILESANRTSGRLAALMQGTRYWDPA